MPYRYGGLILVVIGACMVGTALLAVYPVMAASAPDIVRVVALITLVCGWWSRLCGHDSARGGLRERGNAEEKPSNDFLYGI